jgi:anti-sigma28 factor (negative regulator of flagellin synthesis)
MEARDYSEELVQIFIDEQVQKSKKESNDTDARREKIENLKTMIRAGLYNVSSNHIAERLVEVLEKNVRIKLI